MTSRRVVISGLGAISPLGLDVPTLWQALLDGRCGIAPIKAFDGSAMPCQLAGEVPDYSLREAVPKSYRKATKLMSRDIELAVYAAAEAFKSAQVVTKAAETDQPTFDAEQTAICYGAGLISCDLNELAACAVTCLTDGTFDLKKWGTTGMMNLTPLWMLKYLPNMLPCHIGIIHDIQGPSNTITCGEVSAHIAITEAAEMIARGDAQAAVGGGAEAKVNPIVMLRPCLLGRAATDANATPQRAIRPFAADAGGCVFGEAGTAVVMEEYEFARRRGAPLLAEFVAGASSSSLNPDRVHLEPNGEGLAIAIQNTLQQAALEPRDIDLIIPCGTGIRQDDAAEAAALETVFGAALDKIDIWAIKPQTSHTGAAAGGLELIAAVKAIQTGLVGATLNGDKAAGHCRLRLTQKVIQKPIRYALCCGYSFGGQTAAMLIKKVEGV